MQAEHMALKIQPYEGKNMSLDHNIRNFSVDWLAADVFMGKISAVDLPRLCTDTLEKAQTFLKSYGYDIENVDHVMDLHKLCDEAVNFIEKNLLVNPDDPSDVLVIPPEITNELDIRKLFVWAASGKGKLANWSCSVLRVMHTITHLNNDLSVNFFPQIQKQIIDKLMSHISHDASGDVFLGHGEQQLALYLLDIKSRKSYHSMLLKLLHKPENVGADIFDRIGFRFVTYTRLEALLVMKYLEEHYVIPYPNVKMGRSRNTLVNLEAFQSKFMEVMNRYNRGEITREDMREISEEIIQSKECEPSEDSRVNVGGEVNPFSSTEFHSIQFTCRQLIRIKGPALVPSMASDENGLVEYRFFFPFEVQILDRQNYIESRRGRASHTEYKRNQLKSVRSRVFPWLDGSSCRIS